MVAGRQEHVNAADGPSKNPLASNHAIGVGGKLKLESYTPTLLAVGSAFSFLQPGKDPSGLASRARTPCDSGR